MEELDEASRIWNRAALEAGGENPRSGDRALADILRFHGYVMNGGLGHGFDVVSKDQLSAALAGFRYYGFFELVDFVERTATYPEIRQELLSSEYERLASDEILDQTFQDRLQRAPEDFAPLL